MQGGGAPGARVLDERSAGELVWMMSQVISQGTGGRAQLPDGRPAAGKTGTTQASRDAWFIGFTADYVVGVWMGYDDNTPLTGVSGGGLPAEIWHEVMVRAEAGQPIRPLPVWQPEPRVGSAPERLSQVSAGVETAVRQVVENVLKGLFGKN